MTYNWEAPSLTQILERAAKDRGSETFLVDPDWRSVTFSEFDALVAAAASFLRSRGVRYGDRVCTICLNRTDYFAATFGAWRIGAVVVPLNHEQRGKILAQMIFDVEPVLILIDEQGEKALASLEGRGLTATVETFSNLVRGGSERLPDPVYDPTHPALILFSSGTTGVSKGCVLSNEYMVWSGEEFCRAGDLTSSDSVYTSGPFFHINAWWAFAGSVVAGLRHTFEVRFSASRFWERAAASRATIFDYVGVMIAILLRRNEPIPATLRLRAGLGGAARPAEVEEFRHRFGIALLECYGLTECCLPIFQREQEFRSGSIGKVSEYFEARLVDGEGREVFEGEMGELLLKPLSRRVIFSGYWRRDDLTAAAFEEGWFKTGDICRRDGDGYMYYLDRKRHFIRRRGENISPFEVEGAIFDHPDVANCAIIGVPAELGDEDVLLAVQPKEGGNIDPKALIDWCSNRLASHLVPRYVRVMILPLTPSERVEKQVLRDQGIASGTFDAEAGQPCSGTEKILLP